MSKEEILRKNNYLDEDGFIDINAIHKSMEEYATQCQEDMLQNQTVTRFEVIDENGRVYVAKDCKLEFSYQDNGRTLKVFINN